MENGISMTSRVYQEMKDEIVHFELRPGEVLIVQQLADKKSISRTPIKEALMMLAKDGFVERTSGNKFKVTGISVSDIVDLYELRKLFECYAIKETIDSYTEEDIRLLEENVKAYEAALEANDNALFFELDCDFHNFFINRLNNQILCQFTAQLNDKLQRVRFFTVHLENRQKASVVEHTRIIQAIEEHDASKAQKELRKHLDNVLSDITDNLAMQKNILMFSNVDR